MGTGTVKHKVISSGLSE